MFSHVEGLVPHDSFACSDDEYEEDGTDSDESNGITNNGVCKDNADELHHNTPAEELSKNDEISGESESKAHNRCKHIPRHG